VVLEAVLLIVTARVVGFGKRLVARKERVAA